MIRAVDAIHYSTTASARVHITKFNLQHPITTQPQPCKCTKNTLLNTPIWPYLKHRSLKAALQRLDYRSIQSASKTALSPKEGEDRSSLHPNHIPEQAAQDWQNTPPKSTSSENDFSAQKELRKKFRRAVQRNDKTGALKWFHKIKVQRQSLTRLSREDFRGFLAVLDHQSGQSSTSYRQMEDILRSMWAAGHQWELLDYKTYVQCSRVGGMRLSTADALMKGMREYKVEMDHEFLALVLRMVGRQSLNEGRELWDRLQKDGRVRDVDSPAKDAVPLNIVAAMVNVLAKWDELEAAMELLTTMNVDKPDWNAAIFRILIYAHGNRGELPRVEELFQDLITQGIQPSTSLYANLIIAQAKCGKIEKAVDSFHDMQQRGIAPDAHVFDALIHGLVAHDMLAEAGAQFHAMIGKNLMPPVLAYVDMISGHIRLRNQIAVARLLRDMKDRNVAPHPFLYTAMMHAYFEIGDISNALRTIGEAKDKVMDEDPAFITALLKGIFKNGATDKTNRILAEYEAKFPLTAITCSITMAACIRKGDMDRAKDLFRRFRATKAPIDPIILSVLLNAHLKTGDIELAFNVLSAIKENPMSKRHPRSWVIPSDDSPVRMYANRLPPYLVAYRTAIHGLCLLGLPDRAWPLVEELSAEYPPDPIIFTSFLTCYARRGELSECMRVFGMMQTQCGIEPSLKSFATVYRAYLKAGRSRIVWWHEYNQAKGIKPGEGDIKRDLRPPFCAPIHPAIHRSSNTWFLSELKAVGIEPAGVVYAAMINAHAWYNEIGDAEAVFLEAHEEGIEIRNEGLAALVALYQRNGEEEKARALEGEFKPEKETWTWEPIQEVARHAGHVGGEIDQEWIMDGFEGNSQVGGGDSEDIDEYLQALHLRKGMEGKMEGKIDRALDAFADTRGVPEMEERWEE